MLLYRIFTALACALTATGLCVAQTAAPPKHFEEAIDRAIANERALIGKLRDKEPVIETYIQELKADPELEFVPRKDHYFLGRLNLSEGIVDKSYLPNSGFPGIPHIFTAMFTKDYYARGFADQMFLDIADFDRAHYTFELEGREFLGEVRCLAVDVQPKKEAGKRRFAGRLWVEDRDYHIVRINGSYIPAPSRDLSHFDSWRLNTGGLWLPSFIYAQDESERNGLTHSPPIRAQTRLWDYQRSRQSEDQIFMNMSIDVPQGVRDSSETSLENSPLQSFRMWEQQAAVNVTNRLQRAGLLAPTGEVDQVLDTVLNNLEVTNNIYLDPPIRARVLLTTPLESIAVNHTILISRGLIDVLPDEASLAAVLAHELAHIALGHSMKTKYAFADRLLFDDPATLKSIAVSRTKQEEQAADTKALEILNNSPYKDALPRVGLFLRMLAARSNEVPHLVSPLLGNRMADSHKELRLPGLMDRAPELRVRDTQQISALPLGSRIRIDPWSNQLHLLKAPAMVPLEAKEKLPFQITPFMLHLTREDKTTGAPEDAKTLTRTAKP
jgi:peptidase M48-like protein